MKKRLLSLLVSLCLLLSVFPVSASAASYSGSCGKNVSYSLVNGVMTISGTGAMERFAPTTVPWQDYRDEIQSVVIKEGVTTVGSCSFFQCENLTSVTLPSTLKAVQEDSFLGCTKLTAITLPDGLEELWDAAFSYSGIQHIVVPDSVTLMRPDSLGACPALISAVIGTGVTEPQSHTFAGSDALESVIFRGKLKYVSYCMFSGCRALKKIVLPDSVTAIQEKAFENSGLTEIQMGNAVTEIGDYAFSWTPLEQIVLPQSMKKLGQHAFDNCLWLVSIDFGGLEKISDHTLEYCRQIRNITVSGKMNRSILELMDYARDPDLKINYLGTKNQWARYYVDGNVEYPDYVHFDDHAHRYVKGELTSRNCEESSFYPYTCTICGDEVDSPIYEKSQHVWDEGRVTVEPTCTQNGQKVLTCTVCGATMTVIVYALGHDYVWTVLEEPTYYTPGKNQYTCTRCGDSGVYETPEKEPFEDVAHNSFYRDAVIWATEQGITTGVDAAHFQPDSKCTRGQAVTFLWRSVGKPEYSENAPQFEDVGENRFCYDSVSWAVENGVTKGMDGVHFAPDAACTRGQIVTFLWRSAGCPEPTGEEMPFRDVKAGSYCETAVQWAVENGIAKGVKEDQFQPNEVCTRAQIVTFLYRYESIKGEIA